MKVQPSQARLTEVTIQQPKIQRNEITGQDINIQTEDKTVIGPSLASISSKGISQELITILLDKNSTKLSVADKKFNIEHSWSSRDKTGTFSTPMVYSPVNNCYYTGLIKSDCKEYEYMSPTKYLTALNTDGTEKWVYDEHSITADPVFDNKGNVYVRSQDHLTVLDKNGKKLWKFKAPGSIGDHSLFSAEGCRKMDTNENFEDRPPQVGTDGTVYILASKDGNGDKNSGVTAVKNGKKLWCSEANISDHCCPEFKVKNGLIYVSKKEQRSKSIFFDEDGSRDVLTCLNPDGTEKFELTLSKPYKEEYGATRLVKPTPFNVTDDGSIYISSRSGKIVKYSPEGKKAWEYQPKPAHAKADEKVTIIGAPIPTKDGNILFTLKHRKNEDMRWTSQVFELNSDGKEIWQQQFNTEITTEPKIDDKGRIYFKTCKDMEDGIVQLHPKGLRLNKFTAQRDVQGVESILSFNFGHDGNLSMETMDTKDRNGNVNPSYHYNHKREVFVISADKKENSSNEGRSSIETGKIEKTKDNVIINGVKVPIKGKSQDSDLL